MTYRRTALSAVVRKHAIRHRRRGSLLDTADKAVRRYVNNYEMDIFTQRLQALDVGQLKAFLQDRHEPCYESQLLRVAFPELEIAYATPLALYEHHFLLFHVLYALQDEFYRAQAYLFIHFMRTVLRPYPPAGACRFFHEQLTTFCHAPCPAGADYCAFHQAQVGETALEALSLKYFYADPHNFFRLDEETATAFMDGTWEILTHYETYQQSFRVLGLPETGNLDLIKKRFKQLARQHHPDFGATSQATFVEINNAYRFLLRVIPVRHEKNTSASV